MKSKLEKEEMVNNLTSILIHPFFSSYIIFLIFKLSFEYRLTFLFDCRFDSITGQFGNYIISQLLLLAIFDM